MKFITYKQYIEYLKKSANIGLKESSETYTYDIYGFEQNEIYNEKRIKEVDKKHDKMIRNILSRKKEMVNFLNKFLNIRDKIEEKQIIQCNTDFITKRYEDKHSDIIYKLKNKPVYFLVEHQSSIDYDMPLRIWEYVGEIMRHESIAQKTYLNRNRIYPVVVPIVIYTGFQKWKAKTNFAQKQYQSKIYREYEINLEYNLISVQDFTFEELLENKTLFSSIMIMEKCKNIEELILQIDKIIEVMNDAKDLEAIAEIIANIMVFRIGQEKANEILEKIRMKGEMGMSPLTKMLFDLEYKNWKKGQKDAITKTIKNMIQCSESDEKIIEYTGISKEELQKIRRYNQG